MLWGAKTRNLTIKLKGRNTTTHISIRSGPTLSAAAGQVPQLLPQLQMRALQNLAEGTQLAEALQKQASGCGGKGKRNKK